MDLTFHNHRIDDAPDIIDCRHANHLCGAGIRIDFHLANMASAWIGEVHRIIEGVFFQTGLQRFMGIVVGHIGGQGHCAEINFLIRARNSEFAILEFNILGGGFHQMGSDLAGLVHNLAQRFHDGFPANRQGAGSISPHAECDAVRVPMFNIDVF